MNSAPPLSVDDALARLLDMARPLADSEPLDADQALGRILAEPVVSGILVPPLDNSAMDGYALRVADWTAERWLPVSQRIPAGALGRPLAAGEAARIFTGAPLPDGADAVAMQEDCDSRPGAVLVRRPPSPGDNIRRAGEDVTQGQAVLAPGQRLTAARLGVAASVGATRLTVRRRLRVALFFTGDELVMPGQPLPAGRIYNSNRATLIGLARGLGCEVLDLGQVPDRLEATLAVLEHASRQADVVITSGGVSVGEEDHVKAAVERLGSIHMWQVAMKPGKPLVFGQVGDADFLGLPGNPVSAFVVFCLFARPFLTKRMGGETAPTPGFSVPAAFDRPVPGKRREFLRARLLDGRAVLYPSQSSGVLTSVAWADGLVDLDRGVSVRENDAVRYIPLSELI